MDGLPFRSLVSSSEAASDAATSLSEEESAIVSAFVSVHA